MVDVENTPPFDVLMKLNGSAEKKELEGNDYEEKCLDDDELRIALEVDDADEMLDVESPDLDELDGSDTSSSAVGGSPQRATAVNIVPIMLASDIPQTSCSEGFPYHSILESHKRCHTGEKPFNCHFCEKKFAQKATLQVHERTHTGERPYKCRYCEKTFAQYGTKTVHEKSAHLGIRNYKCPKCDKCLSSPSALYTHKKTHGEKTFQCEFCPKTFTLKNYLKLHVKQVHEQNERKHVCRFCGKSFAYAGSLQVHVRTHTGERPYQCSYCPKAFASQGNLQSHERTHTGERPYSCSACGRSFIQKSQLIAHEATHASSMAITLPKEDVQVVDDVALDKKTNAVAVTGHYHCKFCGKRYAYASSLYCDLCFVGVSSAISRSLTKETCKFINECTPAKDRRYTCNTCGKSYAQKVGLNIHLEQCEAHLANRQSESCVKVDTDLDSSDSNRKADFSLPNIYASKLLKLTDLWRKY
ncbi:unnamed protein product [Angiostrongylus costaricensis]|uniref:Zinc finger protein n=1 Tax=Angiostrongylus costaricensis TaxID=334426 RepID=A0A0R3PMU5_ANGCS|nr:unnamed protein product [Angiostrongylus costaricensis]